MTMNKLQEVRVQHMLVHKLTLHVRNSTYCLYLTIIIMINPIILLLPWLTLRMSSIIHWQTLPPSSTQDAQNAHCNALRRHIRTPILPQETQTNISIRVHMFVPRGGLKEINGWGLRRIIGWKLDPQSIGFSFVQ